MSKILKGLNRWRRGRVVLLLSLAFNLLLAGIIVGAWVDHRPAEHRPDRDGWRHPGAWAGRGGPLFAALPSSEIARLRAQAVQRRASLAQGCAAQRERFEALLDGVRAQPFDRARVARLLAAQREVAVTRQMRAEAKLLDYLSGVGDAERQRYVARLDALVSRSRCGRHPSGPPVFPGQPGPRLPHPYHGPAN